MTDVASARPAVDLRALDGLREQVGDNVVTTVLNAYLDALPARVSALRAATQYGGGALRDAAHALTASSRAIGARELGDLCARAEHGAVTGDAVDAAAAAEQAAAESERVRRELEAHLGRASSAEQAT